MGSQKVQAVIFDFGNVLGRFDKEKVYQGLCEYSTKYKVPQDLKQRLGMVEMLTWALETGNTDDELLLDIVSNVIKPTKGLDLEKFRDIWGNIMSPNDGAEEVIARLSLSVKKFVLSNTEPIHWRYIAKLPVMQRFFWNPEILIRSYVVGVRKPDEKIFQEGIRRARLRPDQILYIDDIPEYVGAFEKLGGHGFVYNCTVDPLSKLENALASHGLLV